MCYKYERIIIKDDKKSDTLLVYKIYNFGKMDNYVNNIV